jgi:hypothetical protein
MYDRNLSLAPRKRKIEWKRGGAASKRLFQKGRIGWLTARVF